MRWIFLLLLTFILIAGQAVAQLDSLTTDSISLLVAGQETTSVTNQSTGTPQVTPAASSNPNISVIGDFRTHYNREAKKQFGAELHETEFSFQSTIDPYAKADFFYSLSRDAVSGEYKGEIEEGYLSTLSLPAHLQLKAGKFRSAVGRINPVHPHALPFIDVPEAYKNYFGEDGLNDEGLSISWLLPNQAFYQEITFELSNGPHDNPSFHTSQVDNFLKLGHLKNFWDLNRNTTLEFGITGISGENDSLFNTNIFSADLTIKWKPVRLNTYHSLTWQSEFYFCNARPNDFTTVNSTGFYSFLNYQVGKRWFLCGRYDYSNTPFDNSYLIQSYSATAGWYATEFQKIEIEGKTSSIKSDQRNYEVLARWIFVIGSHGAHQY